MLDLSHVKNTLVVVAHPDDEILGCGGTIARLRENGCNVHIFILGGVTTSRFKNSSNEESWKGHAYQDEAENAMKVLGVTSLVRSNFPDNRFDTIPMLELIKPIEKAREKILPDLILTHDYSDLNIDHQLTHRAVLTAFRPNTEKTFRIMTFEILSSTEWQDQSTATFRPNCYININEFLDKKIAAMRCYQSELHPSPHPRSLESITTLARKRGSEVFFHAAEAFRIVRETI